MLNGLRFLVFSAFVLVALARNAPAMKRSVEMLTSASYFAPSVPCIACGVGALVLAAAYSVWLAGATFQRWRMPLWTHAVPAAGVLATMWLGPLMLVPDGGQGGPAERCMGAMQFLVERLARQPDVCRVDVREVERQLAAEAPPTGFRSFGRVVPFRLVVLPQADAPVRELREGDGVGTIYLSCPREGRVFWLSAVASDRLPRATPTLLRDGVGKVAVLAGESKP